MLHLFDDLRNNIFSKENEVTSATSILFGCYYIFDRIHPSAYLVMIPWDVVLTAFKGLIVAAIMPMVTTFFQEFYKKKISPRIFKIKSNGTKKNKKVA